MRRRNLLKAGAAAMMMAGTGSALKPRSANAQENALADWARPFYEQGQGAPFIDLAIFGDVAIESLNVSRSTHRTAGAPSGVEVGFSSLVDSGLGAVLSGSPLLEKASPELLQQAAASANVTRLTGAPADDSTLNYLRDIAGLAMAIFEQGGGVCLDLNSGAMRNAEMWRAEVFQQVGASANGFVSIFDSDEEGGALLTTRGMRSFGRPDLKIADVQPQWREGALDVINRFISLHASGGVIPEGAGVKVVGFPEGYVCRHAGAIDDPLFGNVHVSIEPA